MTTIKVLSKSDRLLSYMRKNVALKSLPDQNLPPASGPSGVVIKLFGRIAVKAASLTTYRPNEASITVINLGGPPRTAFAPTSYRIDFGAF